jgi:hypothetical protein
MASSLTETILLVVDHCLALSENHPMEECRWKMATQAARLQMYKFTARKKRRRLDIHPPSHGVECDGRFPWRHRALFPAPFRRARSRVHLDAASHHRSMFLRRSNGAKVLFVARGDHCLTKLDDEQREILHQLHLQLPKCLEPIQILKSSADSRIA